MLRFDNLKSRLNDLIYDVEKLNDDLKRHNRFIKVVDKEYKFTCRAYLEMGDITTDSIVFFSRFGRCGVKLDSLEGLFESAKQYLAGIHGGSQEGNRWRYSHENTENGFFVESDLIPDEVVKSGVEWFEKVQKVLEGE